MKNKYFLIDFGNTNIKACVYQNKKIGHVEFIKQNSRIDTLLNKFNKKEINNINEIIVVSTQSSLVLNAFLNKLTKYIKAKVRVIKKDDFKDLLDFSNVNKNVTIGNDLLLLGLYASTKLKKGAIFCLGTIYTCVVMNKNMFKTVLFVPSLVKAIDNISATTSIPKSMMPNKFDKLIGLNTTDCISAGANLLLEGYVDNVVTKFKLDPSHIIITGGDCQEFKNLKQKYKVIDNVTIKAIPLLINKKNW